MRRVLAWLVCALLAFLDGQLVGAAAWDGLPIRRRRP